VKCELGVLRYAVGLWGVSIVQRIRASLTEQSEDVGRGVEQRVSIKSCGRQPSREVALVTLVVRAKKRAKRWNIMGLCAERNEKDRVMTVGNETVDRGKKKRKSNDVR
jgi:hypothetical protein